MTTIDMQPGAPRHTGLLDRIGEVADILAKDAPECDELGRVTDVTADALRSTGILIEDDETWVPTYYSSAHYWGHEREL